MTKVVETEDVGEILSKESERMFAALCGINKLAIVKATEDNVEINDICSVILSVAVTTLMRIGVEPAHVSCMLGDAALAIIEAEKEDEKVH
jgi:hypothetical protein